MASAASTTPVRARSPDVLKNKVAAEERRKSMRTQGLSPRAEAERAGKAARTYMSHLRKVEAAAAKHFAARGPPTTIGTNADDNLWLERNKTAPGVVLLPCGLQYKVLRSAKSGAKSPRMDTPVEVHYKGRLLGSGEEFWCSYSKRAEPERHVANKIIHGWTVALQLMGVGDKWMLYLPSELAYGDAGSTNGWQNIPPHAALTFELELVAVNSANAPPKVERPKGMTTDELVEAAASVSRPAAAAVAPAACGDENDVAVGNRPSGVPPVLSHVAKSGLFDRAPAAPSARRRADETELSARSRASSNSSVGDSTRPLPSGHAARPRGHASDEKLRSQLAEAKADAAAHALRAEESEAKADALAAENCELRAALDRAIERALQWQAQARSLGEQLAEQTAEQTAEQVRQAGDVEHEQMGPPPVLAVPPGVPPTRTVVLVGATGSGKSSVGNALAGNVSAFGVSSGLSSATAAPAHADFASKSRVAPTEAEADSHPPPPPLTVTRVIDTVGLHDTTLSAAAAMRRFGAFADLVPPHGAGGGGVDLFLFVLPFARFCSACEAALNAFVACCGEGALEHTVLVFTRCSLSHDELKRELTASAPPSLRRIIPSLAFPSVLGVDVVGHLRASQQMLRTCIEEAVEALGGASYSREAISNAMEEYDGGQDEAERAAFAAAVADWRKSSASGDAQGADNLDHDTRSREAVQIQRPPAMVPLDIC